MLKKSLRYDWYSQSDELHELLKNSNIVWISKEEAFIGNEFEPPHFILNNNLLILFDH